jgi:hypothetical protein
MEARYYKQALIAGKMLILVAWLVVDLHGDMMVNMVVLTTFCKGQVVKCKVARLSQMYLLQEANIGPSNNLPAGYLVERTRYIHPLGGIFAGGHGACGPGACGPTRNENKLLGVGVVVIFYTGTSTSTFTAILHIFNQGRNFLWVGISLNLFLSGPWCTLSAFSWYSSPSAF